MEREPFIRAIEVWVPSADGTTIDLQSGIYGEMDYFAGVSRGMQFHFGEGLPGRSWKEQRPILIKDLANSFFVRKEAALSEGLSCAVAVPGFDGARCVSVTLFFCGDDRFRLGALELWCARQGEEELRLEDGYFGRARCFEADAHTFRFHRGYGVPGKAWDQGQPVILPKLSPEGRFQCNEAQEPTGFDRAMAVPCPSRDGATWVLTLVSSRISPVAGRVEHWRLDESGSAFRFAAGYCETESDLALIHAQAHVSTDEGPFARACRKRIPLVDEDLATDVTDPIAQGAVAAGLKSMVVFPLHGGEQCDGVLVWYF
ncbi:hypothetical protein [Novosphingobium profundi]|uniref:hypothetical protein n=1 Tax=Novosphingobium profundi TaxID=1774954 RepID=UPI001CFE08E7|nr:hypothetical protein [Novosphingobium profundi]